MSISVNIPKREIKKFDKQIDREVEKAEEAIKTAINKTSIFIVREAKQNAPVGVSGDLRSSIALLNVEKDGLVTRVGTLKPYAPFVEFGTRKKVDVPPAWANEARKHQGQNPETGDFIESITDWARKKGLPPGPIIHEVLTQGTEPHPFFIPAVNKELPKIETRIKNQLRKAFGL